MNQAPQQAPTKLFREEGKTGAIECPACGAPITLRGFGGVEQVACAYCGTVCTPESDGNLEILQAAERQRQKSVLDLHARGTLDGHEWEILGIVWREIVADGVRYPWQEFLLFNPYQGYRWLIYQMSDGCWSIGGPLLGAPEIEQGMQPVALWQGERYKHFSSGNARVTYVEGEFPWQVFVGDTAQANDYVCPPSMLSIEVQQTDHGADVNFTQMRQIEPAEVWQAFGGEGDPPTKLGVHPAEPNPHKTKFYWLAGAGLFVAWIVMMIVYVSGRQDKQVFNEVIEPGTVLVEPLEFGEDGKKGTLEFELQALGMDNSWAYAEIMLVDVETEEAVGLGLEVDAWSGVSGGEAWREGTNPRSKTVGGVEGGKYMLQVDAKADSKGNPADSLRLTIKHDVPLGRYMFLPFLIIIAFPLINLGRMLAFETKRWANSDHATSSWE